MLLIYGGLAASRTSTDTICNRCKCEWLGMHCHESVLSDNASMSGRMPDSAKCPSATESTSADKH